MSLKNCNTYKNKNVLFTTGELLDQLEHCKRNLKEAKLRQPTSLLEIITNQDLIKKWGKELEALILQLEAVGYVCNTSKSLI